MRVVVRWVVGGGAQLPREGAVEVGEWDRDAPTKVVACEVAWEDCESTVKPTTGHLVRARAFSGRVTS